MVGFFERINNIGGPIDVWAVDGIAEDDLVSSSNGFDYLPRPIPAASLTFVREVTQAMDDEATANREGQTAYQSSLTITFDDGTELTGDEATAFIKRSGR